MTLPKSRRHWLRDVAGLALGGAARCGGEADTAKGQAGDIAQPVTSVSGEGDHHAP